MTTKKYLVLVEDEEFLADIYSTKLTLAGYEVAVATDGEKALKLILEGTLPDLVLLDIRLPKVDGFEVLRQVKANKNTKAVPVILMTNLSQKEEITRGMEAGATDYLMKTHFMPSEVVKKIQQLLGYR